MGSAEHKTYPSPAGPPALRSDATPCDPQISFEEVEGALKEAIRRSCISATFEQGFPKYVWGWLHEARHINGPGGGYKGYPIEAVEYPRDSEKRLEWENP